MKNLKEKNEELKSILINLPSPLYIACSGGLDSRFLVYFCLVHNIEVQALHITGKHIDSNETEYLDLWSKDLGLKVHRLEIDILQDAQLRNNPPLRCYYCKHKAFSAMLDFCKSKDSFFNLCDGSHFEDLHKHRPGLKALQELEILSPLALAQFTKEDIRQSALNINLDKPLQQARPCLLTRFPYDTEIKLEKLEFIQKAENICMHVMNIYFENAEIIPDFRIREVRNNCFELHSTHSLPFPLVDTLQKAIKEVIFNETIFSYKQVTSISGYFDETSKAL